MAVFIGQFVGGLVATYLLSRLCLWAAAKFNRSWPGILAAHGGSLALATIVAGYGYADGGPPQFFYAFSAYLLPQVVWLVVDLIRWGRQPVPS
jgi:hypothetical protein